MDGRKIYEIWAPNGVKWSQWVRPVPFVAINKEEAICGNRDFIIPDIKYLDKELGNIAIFIDLPGCDSIKEGIGLARKGFRLIPIYNGTIEQKGAIATVNNRAVEFGLILGAMELGKIELSKEALPAFLLDSNRMNRYKMDASVFDNSWDIYPQDIPSAKFFIENNIKKILIRGNTLNKDLEKILYGFQKEGIEIFFTNGCEDPKKIKLKKSKYKN